MEAIIFIGIQAAGKSSFYKARFFTSHVRINLDMLRTRRRESLLLRACLDAKQPFVVDNTNVTAAERADYMRAAKSVGFHITGYYFRSNVRDALARNSLRPEGERVPDKGLLGTYKRLEVPTPAEGFDGLYYVALAGRNEFTVEGWADEVR